MQDAKRPDRHEKKTRDKAEMHALMEIAKSITRIPREMNANSKFKEEKRRGGPQKKKRVEDELDWLDTDKEEEKPEESSCVII
mmetsp:Transcript_27799/g.38450  ORF Transcript_27799/g.38450 Transcript_27799/m.38450 type:complete len:83 (-) Transcript_27799:284-532(-)